MSSESGTGISRRTFLQVTAAVPLAAGLKPRPLIGGTQPRIAVVGAGAFGGWTALQLRLSGANVVLIDSWGPGNTRSSSGGDSRVIRAIYGPDRQYVEMVKRSYELWEMLEASADERLYVETGALWLHRKDDAYVRSSLAVLEEFGFPADSIPLAHAKRRYPQINFAGIKSVWLERRAGALSARRACVAVRDSFVESGGTYRTAHVKPGPVVHGSMTGLQLDDGSTIEADVYLFASGPWLGQIFPQILGERIRPTRQEVYYFGTPRGSDRYMPASLPIWIDFGDRILYGIPDVHGRGFKIADDTRGEPIDPTSAERTPTAKGLASAREFLAERFPELAKAPLLSAEVCQYENSPDGHLIVDRHPEAKNVWLAGGGSGHGFKLSPAVGEMTAQAILSGKAIPKMFRLARLGEISKPSTQFEIRKKG